jgi:hypothetical protein
MLLIGEGTERGRLRGLVFWALGSWLVFFAAQALSGPFDGYVREQIDAPGGLALSGPFIGRIVLHFARPFLTLPTMRLVYSLMLIVAPLLSILAIAGIFNGGTGSRRLRVTLIAAAVFLAVLAVANIPYLSNDL